MNKAIKKYKRGGKVPPILKYEKEDTFNLPNTTFVDIPKFNTNLAPYYNYSNNFGNTLNTTLNNNAPVVNPTNDYILNELKNRQNKRYKDATRPMTVGDFDRGSKYKAQEGVELTTDKKIQGISDVVGTGLQFAAMNASSKINKDGTINNQDAFFKGAGAGAGIGGSLGTAVGGPIGTAIGTGVGAIAGGVMSMTSNKKRNKQIEAENAKAQAELDSINKQIDRQRSVDLLSQYNSTNPNVNILKYGGQIYAANGGQVNQITPTTAIANGNTHAEGGIELSNGDLNNVGINNGNYSPVEVEDNEIIYDAPNGNKRILSDKLGFSELAKQYMNSPTFKKLSNAYDMQLSKLNKQESTYKKKLSENKFDNLNKNTYTRQIQNVVNQRSLLKHPLDDIYTMQEVSKGQTNNTKYAKFGKELINKGFSSLNQDIDITDDNNMFLQNNIQAPYATQDNIIDNNIDNTKMNYYQNYMQPKTNVTPFDIAKINPKISNFKLQQPKSITDLNTPENKTIGYYGDNYLKPFNTNNVLGSNNYNENIVNNVDTTTENTKNNYDLNKGFDIFKKGVTAISPYVDNYYNMKLIDRMQAPNQPKLLTPEQLKTQVDINDQLQDIQGNASKISNYMDINSSNSAIARASKARIQSNAMDNINKAYANKNQLETSLINQNKLNRQGINAANTQSLNTYKDALGNFRNKQSMLKSQNISNAVEDYRSQVAEKNIEKLDNKKLVVDAIKNGDTNVAVNLAMYGDVYDDKTIDAIIGLASKDPSRKKEVAMLKRKYNR